MNFIALLQFLKNTEGGAELLKQTMDLAIKMNAHQRIFGKAGYILDPMEAARFGYEHSFVFAGLLYEAAVQLPSAFWDFGNKDIKEIFYELWPKFKGEARSLKNKFKQGEFDDIFFQLTECLYKLKSGKIASEDEGHFFSRRALNVYAPAAHKLGMRQLKDELEVLSFNFLYPNESLQLKKFIAEYYKNSGEVIGSIRNKVKTELIDNGVKYISISGRQKNLYRIYEKLLSHNREMLAIHDIIALRIIVDKKEDCYLVMQAIHRLWQPVKKRQKDYIISPKSNGYQSLHTTVYCGHQTVEFQIRTRDMDREAEYGVAAHWLYKENGSEFPRDNLEFINAINNLRENLKGKF